MQDSINDVKIFRANYIKNGEAQFYILNSQHVNKDRIKSMTMLSIRDDLYNSYSYKKTDQYFDTSHFIQIAENTKGSGVVIKELMRDLPYGCVQFKVDQGFLDEVTDELEKLSLLMLLASVDFQ